MKKSILLLFLVMSLLWSGLQSPVSAVQQLLYQNPNNSIDERTDDLISRMTLEEKVAQMLCVWQRRDGMVLNDKGEVDYDKMAENFPNGIGQIGRPSDSRGGLDPYETVEYTNALQKYFVEQTRLGIPVFFHEEALHGHAAKKATSFPQPIGIASTFDPELVQQVYSLIAEEARVRGTDQVLTPVVDIAREPRWGRVEETFGEDPYLTYKIGKAAVEGFQGDGTFSDHKHVVATLKHMAGHGQPVGGNNIAPANYSERVIREIFLYPFKRIVQEAHVKSIMASYNEVNGVPSHANRWMFHDVLRGEWGFDGYVVSDYFALRELNVRPGLFGHHVAKDTKDAARLGVLTGINIELPDKDVYPSVLDLVKEGTIDESMIDDLIRPMLKTKFQFGLFDDPYLDPEKARDFVGIEAHRPLALKAAEETITLLQNKNNVAPLDPSSVKTIAVIGPNADRELLGGYSGEPTYYTTILQGIKDKVGSKVKIRYAEGVKITTTHGWGNNNVERPTPEQDSLGIVEAVKAAKDADVIVIAVGGNEQTSREAWAKNHLGDRTSLQMVGAQDEMVNALAQLGKPIYAFVINGRPLAFNNLLDKADAVFECWYLGQETGRAVANTLFGDVNPSGKLPISIPRSVGHIPAYYNYKPSARRGYLFSKVSPLFPFGYGMSYTTFKFSTPRLDRSRIGLSDTTSVSVDVTNTGDRTGEEVVQMYIRDEFSSVTRPVKELKGFKKIALEPGETKTVTIDITPEKLKFYDIDMNYVVEPGDFIIMVGSSSADKDLKPVTLTVAE